LKFNKRERNNRSEDGGGIFLRNIGKPLPNHTAQKPTRPAFSIRNTPHCLLTLPVSLFHKQESGFTSFLF